MMGMRAYIFAMALSVVLVGCGGSDDDDGSSPTPVGSMPESIVVLGDSVAAGEGINYGYTYSTSTPNRWIGGVINPTWEGQYQLCHQSVQAYGDLVAAAFDAELAKFACTGSTYENGISFDRRSNGQFYEPAQFGDWVSMTKLNPGYDQAKPDLVIITLGADDVSFVDIVTFCATGYTLAEADEVALLGALADPGPRLRDNLMRRFPTLDALQSAPPRSDSSYCVASNPGAVIDNLFWDPIDSGEIAAHYIDLVKAIQARGMQAGKVPHVLFTTYHNPLPSRSESDDCFDLGDLTRDEINYLTSLMETLQDTLVAAVGSLSGVSIADISASMDGHKFCSDDPWTYGLTVLYLNDDSQAPFHPTPEGQQSIAGIVETAVRGIGG